MGLSEVGTKSCGVGTLHKHGCRMEQKHIHAVATIVTFAKSMMKPSNEVRLSFFTQYSKNRSSVFI